MHTVVELRKKAKARGLKNYSKLKKAELEKLLGLHKSKSASAHKSKSASAGYGSMSVKGYKSMSAKGPFTRGCKEGEYFRKSFDRKLKSGKVKRVSSTCVKKKALKAKACKKVCAKPVAAKACKLKDKKVVELRKDAQKKKVKGYGKMKKAELIKALAKK